MFPIPIPDVDCPHIAHVLAGYITGSREVPHSFGVVGLVSSKFKPISHLLLVDWNLGGFPVVQILGGLGEQEDMLMRFGRTIVNRLDEPIGLLQIMSDLTYQPCL